MGVKEILSYGSILAAIAITLVAIIKTPLIRFKAHKWYKPLLTFLTLVIGVGSCIITQLFILSLKLNTTSFAMLTIYTMFAIFMSYNVIYEGTALKDLVHILFSKIKELFLKAPGNKLLKDINKLLDTNMNAVENAIKERKEKQVEVVNEVIIEDNIEIKI